MTRHIGTPAIVCRESIRRSNGGKRMFERFARTIQIVTVLLGIGWANRAECQIPDTSPVYSPGITPTPPVGSIGNSQATMGPTSPRPDGQDLLSVQTFDTTKTSIDSIYPSPSSPLGTHEFATMMFDDRFAMPRAWFRLEGLYWWTEGSPISDPLVTRGNALDSIPGAIGQPGTRVLIGNETRDTSPRNGARFTAGFALNADRTWGVEAVFFGLECDSSTAHVYSSGRHGNSIVAFPFLDPTQPGENASPLSYPGQFSGAAWLTIKNRLQGTEINFLNNRFHSPGLQWDILAGFRHLNFQEILQFDTDTRQLVPQYAYFRTYDDIRADNQFYGAQFGVQSTVDRGRFYATSSTKLAFGETFENVKTDGGTMTNLGGFASAQGGYFTGPTNVGSRTRGQFAVVPQMDLTVGFRICSWANISLGYSILYLSAVARPGQQIDHTVNPANAPAIGGNFAGGITEPARPGHGIRTTDFWAQGLNFGLDFHF